MLSGKTVTVSSDRSHVGDPYENSTYTVVTNLNGIAEVFVTSSITGVSTYTAIVDWNKRLGIGYQGTTLEQKAKVNFIGVGSSCLPDGTLIKLPNDPKIYIIKDCKRYWIRTAGEFKRKGYKWENVKISASDVINSLLEASEPVQDIQEGAMIRARGGIDIYIVKYIGNKKFKRLILNPSVFRSYGHLRWEDVMDIEEETVNSFATSNLVRNAKTGRIYKLAASGDNGVRRHFRSISAMQRLGYDLGAVYEINETDENSYVQGEDLE